MLEKLEEETNALSDEDAADLPFEIEEHLASEGTRLRSKYEIPDRVYVTHDEPIHENELDWWHATLGEWASGTLSRDESRKLVAAIDVEELDEYYVLLGVPNFSFSAEQRDLLELALIEIGCGHETDYKAARRTCEKLRAIGV